MTRLQPFDGHTYFKTSSPFEQAGLSRRQFTVKVLISAFDSSPDPRPALKHRKNKTQFKKKERRRSSEKKN